MMEELHKQYVNSEMEKYMKEIEKEKESFSFIQLDFLVDMRVAESKYKEEYKKDIGGVRTAQLSFGTWLDLKKYEASKFYVKHSNYYLGF